MLDLLLFVLTLIGSTLAGIGLMWILYRAIAFREFMQLPKAERDAIKKGKL